VRERTTALAPRPSRSHAAHGSLPRENSLARICHSYLIFAALRPPCSARPDRVFSRPGWSACLLALAAGRFLASAQAVPAVSGTAPPGGWARFAQRA